MTGIQRKEIRKIVDVVFDRIRRNSKTIFNLDSIPRIEILRTIHRPCSLVLKIRIEAGGQGRNYFIKKLHFPEPELGYEKMIREFRVLKALNEQNRNSSTVHVVLPVACFEDLQTIITEEFSGRAFSEIIREFTRFRLGKGPPFQMEKYSQLCGVWLNHFQGRSNDIDGRPYSHTDTVAEVRLQLTSIKSGGLLDHEVSSRLINLIEQMASKANSEIPVSGMHSDFIPSNVLGKDSVIAVLDFADFRKGPIYRDAITMLHAMDNYCWNPFVKAGTIRRLQKLFLAGYGRKIRKKDLPIVSLLEVRQTLGELGNLSKSMRNHWFTPAARRLAFRRLNKRLFHITDQWEKGGESYTICDVEWEVDAQ